MGHGSWFRGHLWFYVHLMFAKLLNEDMLVVGVFRSPFLPFLQPFQWNSPYNLNSQLTIFLFKIITCNHMHVLEILNQYFQEMK